MKILKQQVLDEWLTIEFNSIAMKSGLVDIEDPATCSQELIYKSIRCLDHETIMVKSPDVNYVITVIALMWQYADHTLYDLRPLIIKFLSRIGYPTSAIITDSGFNYDTGSFSKLNSYIDEIATTLQQSENEVEIKGKVFLLTNFQRKIWESLDCDKVIGISAPTSAGKSFVILLKLMSLLIKQNIDVVYIVPTLSLVTQVTEDFRHQLKNLCINGCEIYNTFDPECRSEKQQIYVLTQEKAIAAFSAFETPFNKPLILVVDEIQNIERMDDANDERAKILFDTLEEFRQQNNVKQTIISGPRIEDIAKVGKGLFGLKTIDHSTMVSPVLNLTYSIQKNGKQYYFKQYYTGRTFPLECKITNAEWIEGYGKKLYNEKFMRYLSELVKNVGNSEQNLIFAPKPKTARKIALALDIEGDPVNDLIQYYADTVHPNYSLCKSLNHGIAYHHGKLPSHVRRTLEKAICDKKINTIVCTTTLMQGVNLPAQNIIIRNPHLYVSSYSNATDLSNYEMANLRGRAGRLMKDFIGRTYVLDESEFANSETYNQESLFDEVKKELPTSYEQKFEEYRDEIEEALEYNHTVDDSMTQYGYLIAYIRQSILRHGKSARKRMNQVGIKLTAKQVAAIMVKLDEIAVPKDICYKNRYWDPLVLDWIYCNYKDEVPATPIERGAKLKLDNMFRFLRDNDMTRGMYEKYIPSNYRSGAQRNIMCSLAVRWSNGVTLKELLKDKRYNGEEGADNIEDTIQLLQNTISYNVPLLLKPLIDMKNPTSSMLLSMQVGAFDIYTREMIEMGIPRETALYLQSIFIGDRGEDDKKILITTIKQRLREHYRELPYWIQIQVDFLL